MSRLEWILGILLAVLLLLAVGIALMLWFRPTMDTMDGPEIGFDPMQPAPTSIYEGQTAHNAYGLVEETAVSNQPDAVLLSVSGDWPHGSGLAQLEDGKTTWIFGFYAPSTGKTAVYSVADNNVIHISDGTYTPASAPLTHIGNWVLDSDEVMQRFLDGGARAFLQREGVTTTTIHFTTDNPDNELVWDMMMFSVSSNNLFQMRINAATGEVMNN